MVRVPTKADTHMRKLLPAACGALAALATIAPTGGVHAQEGCPIGQYLVQTGSGTRSDDVRCLQAALNGAGYNSGPVDGWFGPITHAAVVAYQTAAGVTVDGEVGAETAGTLSLWQPQPRQQTAPTPARSNSGAGRNTSSSGGGGTVSGASTLGKWAPIAECESNGNPSINTGNGYYGMYQFSLQSWRAVGGSGLPSDASVEEQTRRAEMLLDLQGWGAWPSCASQAGYR